MDNNRNDFEVGIDTNFPRNFTKKMRKRKHLDALLKFRSTRKESNDIIRSSEDELFLPHQKLSITKQRSSLYRRYWNYFKHFLSFSFICIFMILCIGLIYANIQLKNEVENLSSRINEIKKNFSNVEFNNITLTIEQLKSRLNFFEQSTFFFKDNSNKIQKQNPLDNLNQNTNNQLNSIRNDIRNLNQSKKIQELKISFEQLTNLVHNNSDKTSIILTEFQSDLDKLQNKIDVCKCSKELIYLKPSMVDLEQLQQNVVTKSNIEKSNNKTENINDIKQIVNQPSVTG